MAVRPSLNIRLSPADKQKLEQRSQEEGRPVGEVIGRLIRENEIFSARRQDRSEATKRQAT